MAAYPHGIQDILDGAKVLSSLGGPSSATDSNTQKSLSCTCNAGGNCTCCTTRYTPKKNQDNSGKKPSISLTIPIPTTNSSNGYYDNQAYSAGGLSPGGRSPQILVTPVDDGYNSQSHPHQHHALDGHHIGAGQNDHHSRHTGHYTPYSPQHHRSHYHGSPGSVSPCSPSPSSPSGLHMSSPPSASGGGPLSASTLLAPPGSDLSYALQTSLLNLSNTGLDIARPRSALSAYTGTGPTTPVESAMDSSYFPGADPSSWMMGRTNSNESGGSINGYAASSPGSASPLVGISESDIMMLSLLSQDVSNNQLQHQSPPSPLQSDTHLSSMQNGGHAGQTTLDSQIAAMTARGAGVPDFGGSATSDDGRGDYDADGDDQVIQRASADFGLGHRRRGSHASIASSNGGGNGGCGVEIRLMSASPIPPINQASPVHNSPGGMMLHNMQLLGLNGSGGCGAPGQNGCHCWSSTGSPLDEIVRCRKENCPCCQHLSTSPNRSPAVVDQYRFGLSPQTVPPGLARSRSSSSASHRSTSSVQSFGSVSEASFGVTETSLSRANSTGALRQAAHKYKPIRPKPCDSLPEINQVTPQHQHHHANSLPTSTNVSGVTTPSVSTSYNNTTAPSFIFPPRPSFGSDGNSNSFLSPSDGGIDMQSPVDGTIEAANFYNPLGTNFGDSSPSSASYSQNNFNNVGSSGDIFAPDFSNATNFSMPDMTNSSFSAYPPGAAAQSSSSHSRTHSHSSILSSPSSATSSSSYYNNNNQPRQSFPSPSRQNTITASNPPGFGHERSRSFADYTNNSSSPLLEEPRHMHGRSVSASFLGAKNNNGLSPIELIVTPASPFPGSSMS
ncbi:hypothetical protein FRB95_009864 [Tulasnella sp. JGI-2019a]|nr:hypothetical protein FRB95_009864 [Tulasnella sp. JGI-2019a]